MSVLSLVHLKYQKCPNCGSPLRKIDKGRQHTSGKWFESLEFSCGHGISYSPNFRREEIVRACPENPDEKVKQSKRRVAKYKLQKYVKKLDVDESWKKMILMYI